MNTHTFDTTTTKAWQNTLDGMTQDKWSALTDQQREAMRDYSGLSLQLRGKEGYRVEVVTDYDETRRFIVGRSTGWRPCHIEVNNRRSLGGPGAESSYKSVRVLYKAR